MEPFQIPPPTSSGEVLQVELSLGRRLMRWMTQRPYARALPMVLLLLVGIYALDDVTDAELTVSAFYLLPIALCTWLFGQVPGGAVALTSLAATFLLGQKHHHHYTQDLYRYWDAGVHALTFGVVVATTGALRDSYARIADMARTDALTGLANRRRFTELAQHEIFRAQRNNSPLTVVLFDADNFKLLNDTAGHVEGDRLLETVGKRMRSVRRTDVPARLGGDEFAILMPDTPSDAAVMVVERLMGELRELIAARNWPVTFSVGVVTFKAAPRSVRDMVHVADEVMYQVKKSGKNALRAVVVDDTGRPVSA